MNADADCGHDDKNLEQLRGDFEEFKEDAAKFRKVLVSGDGKGILEKIQAAAERLAGDADLMNPVTKA
jgi:hypothetical protein